LTYLNRNFDFSLKSDFGLKSNFGLKSDFGFKSNFGLKSDFGLKPDFGLKSDFELNRTLGAKKDKTCYEILIAYAQVQLQDMLKFTFIKRRSYL